MSLIAGCASSTENAGGDSKDVRASAAIELTGTYDEDSIQAKLYTLLETFKSDQDLKIGHALQPGSFRVAAPDNAKEAVACTQTVMESVAAGGGGFSSATFYECSLEGFKATATGGELAYELVAPGKEAPLANKLFTLMKKGLDKGNLGVVKTSSDAQPPCCDIPMRETLEIKSNYGTLSCTNSTGGFAFTASTKCSFERSTLTCPAKGTIDCMPFVSPDKAAVCGEQRKWIEANCPDVGFVD